MFMIKKTILLSVLIIVFVLHSSPTTAQTEQQFEGLMEKNIQNFTNLGFKQGKICGANPIFKIDKFEEIWGKKILFSQYVDREFTESIKQDSKEFQDFMGNLVPVQNGSQKTTEILDDRIDFADCTVSFEDPYAKVKAGYDNTSFLTVIMYAKYSNAATVSEALKTTDPSVKIISRPDLGDESILYQAVLDKTKYPQLTNEQIQQFEKNYGAKMFLFARKGAEVFAIHFANDDRAKAEQYMRLLVGSNNQQQPKPEDKNIGDPVITSTSPDTLPAGYLLSLNESTGKADYKTYVEALTIKGSDLQGATLSTDNRGINGQTGIEFRQIKPDGKGTTVSGYILTHPWAKEGSTKITLTNSGNKSATFTIQITITGTQYLQRRFKNDKVKFFGDWPEIMPNQQIADLGDTINEGLAKIQKPSYGKLGIISYIYENSYWQRKGGVLCGTTSFAITGCASGRDSMILLDAGKLNAPNSRSELKATIVHESAHKLHFYERGQYAPKPSTATKFDAEWKASLGNLTTCKYLPLLNLSWSDGTSGPQCGFVWSYGAYKVTTGDVFEDIATYAETMAFNLFSPPENSYKDIYTKKINLLKQHDF